MTADTRDQTMFANQAPAQRQPGFTLVEMMVALAAGLIVSAAVVAFLLSSMRSNGEYVQSTRLTQELRNTLDLVTRDLSRAGYSDSALVFAGLSSTSEFAPVFIKDDSPAVTAGTPSTYANADDRGCVIYAYDRTFPVGYATKAGCSTVNGCGTSGQIDVNNGEIRGLRRVCVDGDCNSSSDVGVIEFLESKSGLSTPSCAQNTGADYSTYPPTCNAASGWCPLSDPKVVNIKRFAIINTSTDLSNSMRIRDLTVFLEGSLVNTPDYTRTVTTKVRVRADCINPTLSGCAAIPAP
jgi:prepilin-type N-terminal cleavage/methylation domain-containing protein